jgi:DNA repair protein RadC
MRLLDLAGSRGVEQLEDQDLLALLLSNGRDEARCRQIAAVLLEDFGGMPGIWKLAHEGLATIGPMRSLRLAAAFELGVRCLEKRTVRPVVRCAADVARLLGPRLARTPREQVWVVALDSRNGVIGRRRVAEGGLHGCAVHAPDVLRVVLSVGASSYVLVHNHPGGDPTPSRQDLHLTARLSEASLCVGTPMVDHVILAGDEHRSLLDLGVLKTGAGQDVIAAAAPPPAP